MIWVPGRAMKLFSGVQCCTWIHGGKERTPCTVTRVTVYVLTLVFLFCCQEAPEDGMVSTDACLKVNE